MHISPNEAWGFTLAEFSSVHEAVLRMHGKKKSKLKSVKDIERMKRILRAKGKQV